jgi:carbonic anhydrase
VLKEVAVQVERCLQEDPAYFAKHAKKQTPQYLFIG